MFILQRKDKDYDVDVQQPISDKAEEEQRTLLANGHIAGNGVISNVSVPNGYPKNGYKTSPLINGNGATLNGSIKTSTLANGGSSTGHKNGDVPLLANGYTAKLAAGGDGNAKVQLTQRKVPQQQK